MVQVRSEETRAHAERPVRERGFWISLLVLALVPFLFYSTMVLRNWEPPAPDTGAARPYGIWGKAVMEKTGEVPQWFPHIFSGMPSYGSYIFTPRSPINPIAWVHRILEGNRGAYYVFLFFLAGLGLFAFLRRQGFSRVASVCAALLFSMTPYFPGAIAAGHSTKLEALCLLPWLLLAIELLLEKPDLLRSMFLAAVGAMLAWSHHPQIAFYGLLVGALYAAGALAAGRGTELGRRGLMRLGGFVLLAAVLAGAMAAEPFWAVREYAAWSIRGGTAGAAPGAPGTGGAGWDYATAWSFHPKEMISFLFPTWYGLEGVTYWGPMPFTQSTHYFGAVALALALFGLVRGTGRRRWIWGGISAAVLLIGFGHYLPLLYGPLYYLVPFFNKFRVPSMIYSVLPLCLAWPIASGIDVIQSAAGRWAGSGRTEKGKGRGGRRPSSSPAQRVLLSLGVLAVVWLLITIVARASLPGSGTLLRANETGRYDPSVLATLEAERLRLLLRGVAQVCALLGLALLALWAAASGRWSRRLVVPGLGLALAVLAVADVLLIDRRFYHVEPRPAASATIPLPGAAQFLARQPGAFRILPAGDLFSSNAFTLDGLESIAGYHPAKLRAYQDLLDDNRVMRPGVLKMLNVRYILSSQQIRLGDPVYAGDGYVYAYPDSLPRAWSVAAVESVPDRASMLRRLEDDAFDPEETALLYPENRTAATRFAPARVVLVERAPGRLGLKVEAGEGGSFVVVSEISYPRDGGPRWTGDRPRSTGSITCSRASRCRRGVTTSGSASAPGATRPALG